MADVHRYKIGDIEVTVLSDGFRKVPVDGNYLSNASADDLAKAAHGGGPADRQDEEHLFADRADDGRQARAVRHRQRRGRGGARATTSAARSTPNLAAAGIDRNAIDVVVISHFHADHVNGLLMRRQQDHGISERRDHGAGGRMEVLDGRRRDEPRLARPHDRAVRRTTAGCSTRSAARSRPTTGTRRSCPASPRSARPATASVTRRTSSTSGGKTVFVQSDVCNNVVGVRAASGVARLLRSGWREGRGHAHSSVYDMLVGGEAAGAGLSLPVSGARADREAGRRLPRRADFRRLAGCPSRLVDPGWSIAHPGTPILNWCAK